MNEVCPHCGRSGQIKAHGYLRGYDDGEVQLNTAHPDCGPSAGPSTVRGLRFFVPIDTPTTPGAVAPSRCGGPITFPAVLPGQKDFTT